MKTAVLGGMSLFGDRVAEGLAARGGQVVSLRVDRNALPPDPAVPLAYGAVDLNTTSVGDLVGVFTGCDALVASLSVPTTTSATGESMRVALVKRADLVVRAALEAGVGKIVLLGSYYTAWDRMHPGSGFASRHPYVAARIAEAQSATALGEKFGASVCVLEVPCVFGAGAGEQFHWRDVVFDRLHKPVIMFPFGGTSAITSQQLADAVIGALENGRHGGRYPLSDMELTWREIFSRALDVLNLRTPILGSPRPMCEAVARGVVRRQQAQGRLRGLSPEHVVEDILGQHVYVDACESRDVLRYRPGGVPQAIGDSVRAAYGMPLGVPRVTPSLVGSRGGRG